MTLDFDLITQKWGDTHASLLSATRLQAASGQSSPDDEETIGRYRLELTRIGLILAVERLVDRSGVRDDVLLPKALVHIPGVYTVEPGVVDYVSPEAEPSVFLACVEDEEHALVMHFTGKYGELVIVRYMRTNVVEAYAYATGVIDVADLFPPKHIQGESFQLQPITISGLPWGKVPGKLAKFLWSLTKHRDGFFPWYDPESLSYRESLAKEGWWES